VTYCNQLQLAIDDLKALLRSKRAPIGQNLTLVTIRFYCLYSFSLGNHKRVSNGRMFEREEIDEVPQLEITNPPFQLIPTRTILRFIYSNVLKFGYGFEYSLIKDGGDCISSESSKMATMFLQLLRVSLGAACLEENSALWIDIGRHYIF